VFASLEKTVVLENLMRTLQSILLATDFRAASQAATEAAVRLAATFGSRVTVFHVLEPFPMWPVPPQEQQRLLLERLASQQVKVGESLIGVGPAADTIVKKADELDVDLILIGTGEKERADRLAVGPIAEAVLEQARQPVLAVRPTAPALQFKRILCPVDHSAVSRQGLENAVRLAQFLGGEVVVLSVVPNVSWLTAAVETGQLADTRSEYEVKWRAEFAEFLKPIDFGTVAWRQDVRLGEAGEQIVAAARAQQADLIVMGATGRTGLVRVLLGSTTRRVLQDLPCALLTVKDEDVLEPMFAEDLDDINRWMMEGRERLQAGEAAPALARFRQVLARNPFHVAAVEGRADCHEKLGQAHEAGFYRQRAAKLRQQAWA